MEQVRMAKKEDMQAIYDLWKQRFGDSPSFMKWLFSERFAPEYAAVAEMDGQVISAMQSYLVHIKVRNCILPAVMLAGVSTDPAYEGQGYMRRVFHCFMQMMHGYGIPLVVNTPVSLPLYFGMGHYPVTDSLHVNVRQAWGTEMPNGLEVRYLNGNPAELQLCYHAVMQHYSGYVSRTMADFALKCRDYASDGARCLQDKQGQEIMGYAIYYKTDTELQAAEVLAKTPESWTRILDGLRSLAQGGELSIKIPPDVICGWPDAKQQVRPQAVAGAADIRMLLCGLLGDKQFVFQITDPVIAENNGIWDGEGNRSDASPQIACEAGRLVQLLLGYCSVKKMEGLGQMQVFDRQKAIILDKKMQELCCFIVDEY